MDIPAGGSTSVGADPGPQLFFVQRGSGNATTHSAFAWPPVSDESTCSCRPCLVGSLVASLVGNITGVRLCIWQKAVRAATAVSLHTAQQPSLPWLRMDCLHAACSQLAIRKLVCTPYGWAGCRAAADKSGR